MKLLVLTNYFTPDLSAGSFRMQALVDALDRLRVEPLEVDVVTTVPSRYASLTAEAPHFEDRGWVRIHRVDVASHRGGMMDQSLSYGAYARRVLALARSKKWDGVFATSSRLMTAGLGAWIARRQRVPLYLDIRDLFTDNMKEILAGSPLSALRPAFGWIERAALRRANRVNVVSGAFVPHVRALAPQTPVRVLPNGIDRIFATDRFTTSRNRNTPPLILYAGNMGEGQGLHLVLPQVAKVLEGEAQFRLIGDGGRRALLERQLAEARVGNVELLPPLPRAELLDHYAEADILFLHLNDLAAFRKVLPSKLFEYGAVRKPILAGVAGHAAGFLRENLPDAAVFDPLDTQGMIEGARSLIREHREIDRTSFLQQYDRKKIMHELAMDVIEMVRQGLDKGEGQGMLRGRQV